MDISNPEHIQIDSVGVVDNYKYKNIQFAHSDISLNYNVCAMLSTINTYRKSRFSTIMPMNYLSSVYNYYRFQTISDKAKNLKSIFITLGNTLFSPIHYDLNGVYSVANVDIGATVIRSLQAVILHKVIISIDKNIFLGTYFYKSPYDKEFTFCLGGEVDFIFKNLQKYVSRLQLHFLLRYWYAFMSFSSKDGITFFPLFNTIALKKYMHLTRSLKDRYGLSIYPVISISINSYIKK